MQQSPYDPLLRDDDLPPTTALRSLGFIVATESPRMSEMRLGLWTLMYGLVFAVAGSRIYATSLIYAWLAHVPAAFVGWPLALLGVFQLWAVVNRRTQARLWAARIQTVVSIVFLIGCTVSAGFASPAWAAFGINALWSAWTLWRLAPARPVAERGV